MRASPFARRAAFATGLIGTLVACRDVIDPPDPGDVVLVSVSPTAAVLVPGQDLQVDGVVRDRSRVPLPDQVVTWTSGDPSRATVSTSGLVSAVSPGEVVITASSGTASAVTLLRIDEGAWIGPEGGEVSAFGGALTLAIPENALASPTAIRVTPPFAPPLDPAGTGAEFSLRFETELAAPATLSIAYAPENGPAGVAESDLGVRRLIVDNRVPIPGTVSDPAVHRATAEVTSAGTYSVGRLPPTAPCSTAEHRQFDFWVGQWGVMPIGSPDGTRQASSSITLEPGGCAVFEDFRDLDVRGESISLYDPATAKWYQTFVDNNESRLVLAGGLVGGAMVLTQADNAARITWSVEGEDVRQLGEDSADEGATWGTTFDLIYLPK